MESVLINQFSVVVAAVAVVVSVAAVAFFAVSVVVAVVGASTNGPHLFRPKPQNWSSTSSRWPFGPGPSRDPGFVSIVLVFHEFF